MTTEPDWARWRAELVACLGDKPRELPRNPLVPEPLDALPLQDGRTVEDPPQPVPDWPYSLTVQEVSHWRPLPAVEANLDSRFLTAFGVLDVVPRLTGTYQELAQTATTVRMCGIEVLAADLEPILRRLQGSGREKDRQRWALAAHLLPGDG